MSLLVGWGGNGAAILGGTAFAQFGWGYKARTRRLLTFALDGSKPLPKAAPPALATPLDPADFKVDDALAAQGEWVYLGNGCVFCHSAGAVSGGLAPDLRASAIALVHQALKDVVVNGSKVANGMPQFKNISDAELTALQHYLRKQAIVTSKVAEK